VLVNFWATWCPPCRKEMPDLDALHRRFKEQGLVILAFSDEKEEVVKEFLARHNYQYTFLIDHGRELNKAYKVEGIPKSFVYNRERKLVAQSMDMRTRGQFLEMLSRAGLKYARA
jgi:peroxiredoxin